MQTNSLRLTRDNQNTFEMREAAMRPRTFNADDNTVEAVVATSVAVARRDGRGAYSEILDASGANLNGLRGASVLDSHQQAGVASVLGTVDDAWLEGDRIVARIRLSTRPEVQSLVSDVRGGIICSVSVGYEVDEWREGIDAKGGRTRTAVKWTPREISFVPVPADPGARTRGLDRSEQSRAIRALGREAGVNPSVIDNLIDRGVTFEDSSVSILSDIVTRGAVAIRSGGRHHNENTMDNPAVFQRAAVEGLFTRMSPNYLPQPEGRQFANWSCADLARECLTRAGISVTGMMPQTLITRAMNTSSDYPAILANVMHKSMRTAYLAAPSGIRRVAKESSANDFRAKSRVQFDHSGFVLERVSEAGEFHYGAFADSAESYAIDSFGKIFTISRKALINDDLGAFSDVTRRCGMAAAEFERQFLVNILIATAVGPMMSDNVALFDASHGNINASGTPGAATLAAGRLLMRNAVGTGGGMISVTPRYLVVPSALETASEQLITAVQATQTSNVNPFAYLDLIVEPRLLDPKRWYLVADPALIDGLEYSYLAGAPGPQTESKVGFEVDGVAIKTRLDFGGAFIEWRGWNTNAGV